MEVDYLVIGQGLCGSLLCHALRKAGLSYLLIDESQSSTASKVASGIINPVTGRRIVKSWMIDDLMPVALGTYRDIEVDFGENILSVSSVTDFFPSAQMRLAFLERLPTDPSYLELPADEQAWREHFNYELGFGLITPVYLVQLARMLSAFRRYFLRREELREEHFVAAQLVVTSTGVQYRDVRASRVIFCDGIAGQDLAFFHNLPFAPNKGEALIVDIPRLPRDTIFKKGISLVPWENGHWWVGSSHQWQFEHAAPTEAFRLQTTAQLAAFCRHPFEVIDHLSAVRPATLERRPFIGFHPVHPVVGIFNGMGTKGCSLAPYFARELVQHLVSGKPLLPEVNISRFKNVLSR